MRHLLAVLVAAALALDARAGVERGVPDLPPSAPRPFGPNPFDAAQLGVDWLAGAVCSWMTTTGGGQVDCTDGQRKTCFGCHVQAQSVYGLARSGSRCYTVPASPCTQPGDESPVEYATRFVAAAQRKACILGPTVCGFPFDPTTRDGQPPELGSIGHYPDCGSNAGPASIHPVIQSAHGGMNLAGYTRYVSPAYAANVLALADWFVTKQAPDGRFIPDRAEAPVDQGDAFTTGAAATVIATARPHGSPAQQVAYDAALAGAASWVSGAALVTTQDKTFAILTLLEAGTPTWAPDMLALRSDLLDDQLPDGGWAERPGLGSNAYATGQALHALSEAGLVHAHPAACAGIYWLVDHQNLDGSWSIGQAGVTTDSTRNSDFTATMWPVLALGSIRRHGVDAGAPQEVLTCGGAATFAVTITNTADNPCELNSDFDALFLSVTNDVGDAAVVTPDTVMLRSGQSQVVTVEWTRVVPAGPPGSASLTTLLAQSLGARDRGCPVEATVRLSVVVPPDDVPAALGFGLRVGRSADDVTLRWDPAATSVGSYEVVSTACPSRVACATRPTRTVLDAAAPIAMGVAEAATLPGAAAPGQPHLAFYKVRATSPCALTPGPTCDFACSDPDRCHRLCP
jgi:hypothetical protein